METAAASCSTLLNNTTSLTTTNKSPPNVYPFIHSINTKITSQPFSSPSSSLSSISTTFTKLNHCPIKFQSRISALSSDSNNDDVDSENPSPEFAILLEVEGVLMDVYRVGNREAFNLAFSKRGLDCANWTEPIYLDLVRKTGGDEERMVVLFFERIGWPTSLPTNEKEAFVKSVLKEKRKALDEFVMTQDSPLRHGVETFIDDALSRSIPVVILTAYSKNGEKLARSIVEKLGPDRISKLKIVGKEEMEGSLYGQLVPGKGPSFGLDDELAKEASKAALAQKQKIAEEVAFALKVSVDLNTMPTESSEKMVATLRAGAEYAGVPVQNCVLIAGGQSGVSGSQCIAMPCIVLRSSSTSRAEFPSARAIMDGFGGADLTVSKLLKRRWDLK
ncbi:CBBY-like protein [Papaver somniferum]|uniref:CBBY-like protein n=1 Tax=Papaver somniferum TaxID=3469 RepID=UPI000E6FA4A7|nr:CBBY-like protein [Papaver somniferum]